MEQSFGLYSYCIPFVFRPQSKCLSGKKSHNEFGQFCLDLAECFLVRSDTNERVQLPEKAFETLCVLVRNAGHLVDRTELFWQVWADAFVEESNLNKCIHAVRRALGETNGGQQFIE